MDRTAKTTLLLQTEDPRAILEHLETDHGEKVKRHLDRLRDEGK